jgi:hypothetical protein
MSAKIRTQIKSYQDAKNFLGNRKERAIAHNTRLEIDSLDLGHEIITVKYHGNAIVNLYPDGTITLNNCGWYTSTTKERLNWFLPYGITLYQRNYRWIVQRWHWSDEYGRIIDEESLFANGMAIKAGQIYNAIYNA